MDDRELEMLLKKPLADQAPYFLKEKIMHKINRYAGRKARRRRLIINIFFSISIVILLFSIVLLESSSSVFAPFLNYYYIDYAYIKIFIQAVFALMAASLLAMQLAGSKRMAFTLFRDSLSHNAVFKRGVF
ncbi:MAG TPA: hypothetical protein VKS21_06885 [Spirochaetota bacterium]|nr:hypothetical protein [Spirochaetota bacterium]